MDYQGNNQYRDTYGTNLVGAVFLAAALGAVLGMLFAPKKGTETREEIRNRYYDMKHRAADGAADAKERFVRGVDAARSKVHMAADRTKDMTDQVADKTKEKMSDTDDSISEHINAEHSRRRKSM